MPKPKSTTLKAFRLRVDGLFDEAMISFLKQHSERYLLVHHLTETENPHYHAYVETTCSQGNFANKVKASLGVSGSDYSNKVCDSDRAMSYLSYLFNTKNGNQARCVDYQGFSVIDVATHQANAKSIADDFAVRMAQSKKTQYELIEIVIERLKDKVLLPEVIYDVVVDVLRLNRCVARPNHIRDMIASVMAWSDNPYAKKQIKELTMKYFQG